MLTLFLCQFVSFSEGFQLNLVTFKWFRLPFNKAALIATENKSHI